jgi:Fe-S cluster biogenesis protein NfuA
MEEIRITAEPVDNHRCRFTVSVPLLEAGARRFTSAEEAAGSPLAEGLFAIPDVAEVLVSGPLVTVIKRDTAPWQAAGRAVGAAIRAALQSGAPVVAPKEASADPAADEVLYDKVSMIFDTRINPAVASHGGRVDLIDVQDGVVLVRMMGGCQGCGMAQVTLRQGIESTLRQLAPEVAGIADVTDHAAGANPYFASAKK